MTRLVMIGCAGLLLVAPAAEAQITAEVVTFYRQGGTTPATVPVVLDRAHRVCGLPLGPVPAVLQVNPRVLEWPDPAAPTTACQWTDPGTGLLSMWPADGIVYEGTIRFRSAAGEGPEGPRGNPFTRLPVLPLRVRP
jgi:hypothetical protein